MRILILGLLCTLYVWGQNPDPVMSVGGGGGSGGSGTVSGTTGLPACFDGATSVGDCTMGFGATAAAGTLAIDRAVIPSKATAAGTPTMVGQLAGEFAVDTSASPDRLYFCGADDGTDCTAVIRIGGYNEMLPLSGGTVTGTLTLTGALDASGSSASKPSKAGTSLPGTCAVGETYIKTDATAASQFHVCSSTNTWTAQGGSGGGLSAYIEGAASNTGFSNDGNTRYQKQKGIAWTTTTPTDANTSYFCLFTGTLSKLWAHFSSAGTNTQTITYTIQVNGSNTSMTFNTGASHAAGRFEDTSNTAACTAGQRITLTSTQSAGSGTTGAMLVWGVMLAE